MVLTTLRRKKLGIEEQEPRSMLIGWLYRGGQFYWWRKPECP